MEKDKRWKVMFRDVAPTYFPQTRVECRYTLSSEHRWSCRDWIGLFKADWTSLRDYHTYAWASAPENSTPGKNGNCSILFHPSYLPNPGAVAYQFVYVDELEEICAVSSPFIFSAPKPLDELVTLEKEERNGGEENEEDLLLVVPRAQILQHHLEACQEELLQVQKQFGASSLELERQRKRSEMDRKGFEAEQAETRRENEDLRERLRCSLETVGRMEEKQKDVFKSHGNLSEEVKSLITQRDKDQQRINELEDDTHSLMQQKQETEAELERMKQRVKKLTMQRKAEEDGRRNLQTEAKCCREELRVLQECLESSECSVGVLRQDLSELGALHSQNQAELHQIRLQAAQTTLQLSQANLNLRESQAAWVKEREILRRNTELDKVQVQKLSHELQKKEEWLEEERSEREKLEQELGNERACNRELRASVRALQKEQEHQRLEKQELQDHIQVFRLRMKSESRAAWTTANASHIRTEAISSSTAHLHKSDCNKMECEMRNMLQNEEGPKEEVELEKEAGPDEEKAESEEKNCTKQLADSGHADERQKMERHPQTPSEIQDNIMSEFADTPLW